MEFGEFIRIIYNKKKSNKTQDSFALEFLSNIIEKKEEFYFSPDGIGNWIKGKNNGYIDF